MRIATILLTLAALTATTPVHAQDVRLDQETGPTSSILDPAKLSASLLALQPTTQRGGERVFWWPGLAMAAGGGVLAVLSATVWKKYDFTTLGENSWVPQACRAFDAGNVNDPDGWLAGRCPPFKKTNRALLWTGIGVAGAGIILAMRGNARQRSAVTFVPMPGGAAVFRRITF